MTDLLAGPIFDAIARATVEGGLFVAAIWLAGRALPRLPAAARTWLWWLASAKLVATLLGAPAIPLPVLPPPAGGPTPGPTEIAAPSELATTPLVPTTSPVIAAANPISAAPPAGAPTFPWHAAASLAVLLLAGLGLGTAGRELWRGRRILGRSRSVDEGPGARSFESLAHELGVTARLRASDEIDGPRVTGLLRPTVLLPTRDLQALSVEDIRLAIAHELIHLRRHDLWLGLVPALTERVLLFHPLARLAAREYALAREAACDAEVLHRLDPDPGRYARLVLRAGVGRRPLAAAALAGGHPLKRRLEMLESSLHSDRRAWLWLAVPAALIVALPFRLVAADSPAKPAPDEVVVEVRAPAPETRVETKREVRFSADESDHRMLPDAWAYFEDGDHQWMNGSRRDVDRARAARRGDEPMLWVRRDNREWVIRDPALLARVDELLAPQRELGRQQAELGAQQAELGRQQAELGRQQAEWGGRQADVAGRQAELGAQMAGLGAKIAALTAEELRLSFAEADEKHDAAIERLQREREEIEQKMERLGDEMEALGERQEELGRPQEDLGAEQGELGRQQGELGRQQGELGHRQAELARQAEKELGSLLADAIEDGRAQRID